MLLEDFLKELKIPASIDEIFLFMRRYDTDNDGKLRYYYFFILFNNKYIIIIFIYCRFSDFAECITPK